MEAAGLYALAEAQSRDVLCFAHVANRMATVENDFEKVRAAVTPLSLLSSKPWRMRGRSERSAARPAEFRPLSEQRVQPLDVLGVAERQQSVTALNFEGGVGVRRRRACALDRHDVGTGVCAHVEVGE